MNDSVALLLKELRLPGFVRHYKSLWEKAVEDGWSHTDYLSALCEYEISDRYDRRTHKWKREAQLQTGKTFTEFDVSRLSKNNKTSLAKLQQDMEWSHHADNVLLIGPSGTGKTHIASALGHALIEKGVRCKSFPAIGLVQLLQQAKRDLELMTVMSRLDKYQVIIVDDIGYVKKTDAETHVLFEFIAHRYESGSLIITANQPFSEWDKIFPDSMMTVAAIDRLIHHATIIELEGESYRKKHQLEQIKRKKKETT
ncbi:IS21-like element helper ATPase IstB [Shewanella sp.]|uniref:IS21-like element helper ATPase IstB n=1 Tax=Shewanella sp. TaxID=50422 RepID=UPI004053FB29